MTGASSQAPAGFLVVDKPSGISSHTVVSRARRALGTKKIGHAGTLDPMATGVLLLGVGQGTRLLGHLLLADKAYTATIRLGISTVTDDAEGDVIEARGAQAFTRDDLEQAVARYRGDIVQVPSAVSAIKVDGKRAYALVRSGEEVQLKGRPVTVSRFDVLDVRTAVADGLALVDLDVEVECTSGTYIRALARDLGNDLQCGGHLTALRRTRVGPWTLDDSGWDADLDSGIRPTLVSLSDLARRSFDCIEVDETLAREIGYGRPIPVSVPTAPTAVLHGDKLLALYRPEGEGSAPVAVLAPNQ